MREEHKASVIPINSPWRDILIDALKQVRQSLLIVSPYIKEEIVGAMQAALLSRTTDQSAALTIRVITRVEPEEFLSGSSDITALQQLLNWPRTLINSTVEIRAIPNVHAKVWVCDTEIAIIGSGNATPSGLDSNIEYGLKVVDPRVVEHILQDWQQWWQHPHAISVEASELEQMRQKLHQLETGEEFLQAATEHKAIKRVLETIPSIGKPIILARPTPKSPLAKTKQAASPQPALQTSFSAFWQAFCWTIPQEDRQATREQDVFLKLYCKPTQSSPQVPQFLQFIWADGKRHSRASILLHHETVQYPSTLTLRTNAIQRLGSFLQDIQEKERFHEPGMQGQLLFSQAPLLSQAPSVRECTLYYSQDASSLSCIDWVPLPYMPSSTPRPFPTQRPPISQIVVEHRRLEQALTTLTPHASTTLELGFDTPSSRSSITLSTGQIVSAVTETLQGEDCTSIGPAPKLRLDSFSLQHLVASAPKSVTHWQLCIDRTAETVQFIPRPYVGEDATLLWRHELYAL